MRAQVNARGIEGTLTQLREAGVYVRLEEFKCQVPICRPGLTFDAVAGDFDNTRMTGAAIEVSPAGRARRLDA